MNVEGAEYFSVGLSTSDSAAALGVQAGADSMATVFMLERVTVNFQQKVYHTFEDEGVANVTVYSSQALAQDYQVFVNVQSNSGNATAGQDYVFQTYSVNFAAGQTVGYVLLAINNSEAELMNVEGAEYFNVGLSTSDSAAGLGVQAGADSMATVFILERVVVSFANETYTFGEEDGSATLTLVASRSLVTDYNVTIQTIDGSATGGSDYIGGAYWATFAAGSRYAQVTIGLLDNMMLTGSQYFTASLAIDTSGADVMAGSPNMSRVFIKDHEQITMVEFSPTKYELSEGADSVVLMLTASAPASHDFTIPVMVDTGGHSSIEGTQSVTFLQGRSEAQLTINITSDAPGFFTATLSVPEESPSYLLGVRAGEGYRATVVKRSIMYTASEYTVSEDGRSVLLMLLLSKPADQELTVQVQTDSGTAENGEDYAGGTFDVVFEKGSSKANVSIPILDDDVPEVDENFTAAIILGSGQEAILGLNSKASIVIRDALSVVFSQRNVTVSESAGSVSLALMSSGTRSFPYSVVVNTEDGTAMSGRDYTGGSYQASFAAESRYAQVVIGLLDNRTLTGTQYFTASLDTSGAENVKAGSPSISRVFIEDHEQLTMVEFSPTKYEISEGADSVVLMLAASAPASHDFTIPVMVDAGEPSSMGGTHNVTFLEGSSEAQLIINIPSDAPGFFTANLSVPEESPAYLLGVRAGEDYRATAANRRIICFAASKYTVSQDGRSVLLMLMLSRPAEQNLTVQVQTDSGTAEDGEDYVGGTFDVVFEAGSSKANVSVPILDDDELKPHDEMFTAMILLGTEQEAILGFDSKASIVIRDALSVVFSRRNFTVSESAGSVSLTLMSSGTRSFPYSVVVNTEDGTAMSGRDYTGGSYQASFAAESRYAQVVVGLLDNRTLTLSGSQYFTASLDTSGAGNVTARSPNMSRVFIEDHEQLTMVEFSPTKYELSEGADSVVLTMTASAPASHDFTIPVMVFEGGHSSIEGTHNVTFLEGSSEAQLIINIPSDASGFLTATLSVPEESPAYLLGVRAGEDYQATVANRSIMFAASEYTVSEDGRSVALMLMLSKPADQELTVQVQTDSGTAENGKDYDGGSFNVVFGAGSFNATIAISILDDDVRELDEMFTATIVLGSEQEAILGLNSKADIVIRDDDVLLVAFNQTSFTGSESVEVVNLILMANGTSSVDYSVVVNTEDGTAMNGTDYIGGTFNVTFPKDSSKANVSIHIVDDNVNELMEVFAATIVIPSSVPGVKAGLNNRAEVEIEDNDVVEVEIDPVHYTVNEDGTPASVSINSTDAGHGTNGSVCITLKADRNSSAPYTVIVDTQDGSANAPDDYRSGSYQITFAPGKTAASQCIKLEDDNVNECGEDFFVHLRIPEEEVNRGVVAGDDATATVVIAKDKDTFEINFASSILEVFEEDSRVEVCLEHNRQCMEEFSVEIETQASANMSASTGDYQNGPYTVTFPEGSNKGCVEIPVIEDNEEEGPEIFNLEILQPDNPPDGSLPFRSGPVAMAQVTIKDGSIDGDPMFTVPLSINKKMLSQFTSKDQQWDLCYEVHGREEKIYNLVSDQCVSVNTHLKLASNPKVGNIMSKVAIVAMDRDGRCHRILADLTGKTLRINDKAVKSTWINKGIVVHKLGDRIDVAVPNCQGQRMKFSIQFHYMNGADMIKFTIADGRALSPSSHGLIGQFWNAPVEIQAVKGREARTGNLYKVTISSAQKNPRSFIGEYYPITWGFQEMPCLYAGTKNGSPVIEGKFTEYEVQDLFDVKFIYTQFTVQHCIN